MSLDWLLLYIVSLRFGFMGWGLFFGFVVWGWLRFDFGTLVWCFGCLCGVLLISSSLCSLSCLRYGLDGLLGLFECVF